jgi:hypothetical protein
MIHAILTIVGVAALTVLLFFFRYFLTGIGGLVAWANHAGIKGWALFLLGWLALAPLMVLLSVLYGYYLLKEAE